MREKKTDNTKTGHDKDKDKKTTRKVTKMKSGTNKMKIDQIKEIARSNKK
jgi:hypothetical protein